MRHELILNTDQTVHTRCYRNGVLDDEGFSLARVSEHLEDESTWSGWTCVLPTWRS